MLSAKTFVVLVSGSDAVVLLFDVVIVGGNVVVVFGEIVEVKVACFGNFVVLAIADVDDDGALLLLLFRVVVVGFLAGAAVNDK
jgi:hypothetical protein